MVGNPLQAPIVAKLLAVEHPVAPVLERLDPPRRAAVVMALIGIALVGVFLVATVVIGAHWVRKLARHQLGPRPRSTHLENKRLRDALQTILPEGKTDETILVKKSTGDTVVDR